MKQQTQTKQIPKGWKEEKIGNIFEILGGDAAPKKDELSKEGEINFVRMQDLGRVKDAVYISNVKDRVNQDIIKKRKLKIFKKNSILMPRSGSVHLNHRAILKEDSCVVSHIAILQPKKEYNHLFLFYLLKTIDMREIMHQTTGLNLIRFADLKEIEIKVTESKEEQTLIVQEIEKQFTRLDEAVKSLKSVKQKLEIYRKAVLKKAFEKKDGWEEKKIKEVSEKIQYGLTSKSSMDYSGPRYLRITDIQNRKVNWDEVPFAEQKEDVENYILNENDLVFARTGATVGKSFLIKSCPKNSVFASYLIRIVPNKNKISPDLLYYYFQSPMYWEMISQKKLGIGQPNVNGQILSKLPITLPTSMKEQTAIVQEIESKFSVIDKIDKIVETSLQKAEKLRKSILKSAFEGKLVNMGEVAK